MVGLIGLGNYPAREDIHHDRTHRFCYSAASILDRLKCTLLPTASERLGPLASTFLMGMEPEISPARNLYLAKKQDLYLLRGDEGLQHLSQSRPLPGPRER
jgi:hypothetical protein